MNLISLKAVMLEYDIIRLKEINTYHLLCLKKCRDIQVQLSTSLLSFIPTSKLISVLLQVNHLSIQNSHVSGSISWIWSYTFALSIICQELFKTHLEFISFCYFLDFPFPPSLLSFFSPFFPSSLPSCGSGDWTQGFCLLGKCYTTELYHQP